MKELTLLLLHMNSWEDREDGWESTRSWKGYPFHVLNELEDDDFIRGSKRSKSVYLTEEGKMEAEKLFRKYFEKQGEEA